ncbi:hypothetical protein HYPSUDRAFT_43587 [Hypholoma sublateritium FD-334 SS-4]|uniref:BRO1 domain-containing protein n=1 Tax=Hypholoma sublateritium (strain FD-334 SS-4) TaxID=945553 RepID=A0A0D2M9K0_HYPSF|nr:hypothetical protein HYPSUDRAFT_43587 [Hypholoma sublateritium FD-334 SS-4]
MDRRFQEWEERLPLEYQVNLDAAILQEYTPNERTMLARQRYTLHTWYLAGRMKLYVASATGQGRTLQADALMKRTLRECHALALQVVRFQTAAYRARAPAGDDLSAPAYPGNCWLFEGCFSLFEASVALSTVRSRLPCLPDAQAAEADQAIASAVHTFAEVAKREQGRKTAETAVRALEVLATIREERVRPGEGGPGGLPRVKDEPAEADVRERRGVMHVDNLHARGGMGMMHNPYSVSIAHHFTTSSDRDTLHMLGFS